MREDQFTQAAFYAHLAEHRLMASACTNCGKKFLPPRPLCTACYGEEMEWVELAGYGRDNPYCSGIVKLENGLSISAQILDVDVTRPESIVIGTPVQVEFIERGEGETVKTLLGFRPAT
jgi:uncharacterized OB-fold protein